MTCCAFALAALFAAPADPPPADTCCLTYGQVRALIADLGYITAADVSQCLLESATVRSTFPAPVPNDCLDGTAAQKGDGPNIKDFLFIPDQTVGVAKARTGETRICVQWKAVQKKLDDKAHVLLKYDGKEFEGRDVKKFREQIKRSDVVILVMRYVKEKKVCELAQIHVVPFTKVKEQKDED
jgi:hypothetical protein